MPLVNRQHRDFQCASNEELMRLATACRNRAEKRALASELNKRGITSAKLNAYLKGDKA